MRATAAVDRSAGDLRSRFGGTRRSHDRRRRVSLVRRARGAAIPRRRSAPTSHSSVRGAAPVAILVGLLLLLAAFAPQASAAESHPYTGVAFGPDGVGGSASFERVQSIAVDPASGGVYVYDGGAGKIYKFDSAGAPVSFSATGSNAISGVGGGSGGAEFQIALAPVGSPGGTAGNLYVANNGNAIHVYSAAGAEIAVLDQGGETCGVATDPAGNFYAGVFVGNTINKYTPTGNPPTQTDKSDSGTATGVGLCNVAADGLGNVYAANYSGGLYKLEGLADPTPALVDSGANTMAIAPGSNDVYADRGTQVFQYDSSGAPIGSFGSDQISASHGVAVNSGASKIYVGTTGKVKVFGPATTVPDVITEAADAITRSTAVLHGRVGAAGGPEATCVFQYVSETDFFSAGFEGASEKPCSPAGPFTGNSTTAVSATVTGLSAETNYRFRLLATSSDGSNVGSVLSFTTTGAVNVQITPATGLTDSGATLNGTVDPEGVALEECTFEYAEGSEEFKSEPCAESPAAIGSGSGPVPVHLDLAGLRAGTHYRYRLAGKNELGTSKSSHEEFKTKGPTAITESISGISESGASFKATINPNGVATSYVFEYVTQAEFEVSGYAGAASVPVGGEDIGAGISSVEVDARAEGLAPQTTYRFRVVATSAEGVARGDGFNFTTRAPSPSFGPCPNDDFRTGFGAALPDCRAYERATPADKGGLDIEGFPDLLGAASDGSGISFSGGAGSGVPAGGGGRQQVTTLLSSRVGDSWATQRLLPPEILGEKAEYLGSSQDMRFSLVEAGDFNVAALFLIDTTDESVIQVVPYQTEFDTLENAFAFDAISKDGSRLFFESRAKLTPEAVAGSPNLYMWDRAFGEVSSQGLLPEAEGGDSPPAGSFGGGYGWSMENPYSGGSSLHQYVEVIHAATADGDQIYFTAGETGQLYLRRGLAGPSPSTVHVSAPQAGAADPSGPLPAAFQEATPDGAHAFFLSSEKLTADASTGEFDGGKDLYRYDRASDALVDVTAGLDGPANPNGANVQGLLGASSDGSSGYFAARGKLTPEATVGADNIYRFEEESDGTFTFTFVGEGGRTNWASSSFEGGTIGGYSGKASRVSPDAETLVYTGGEQSGQQIYVYRAAEDKATCVSCDPGGTPSIGRAELTATFLNSGIFITPNAVPAPRLTRSLSADGSRVFFQTPNALLADDTNGTPKCNYLITRPAAGLQLPRCMDAYEWESVGAPGGSCTKVEYNGGCLYLLSTGKSENASYFIDASSDGSSAFIATTSQLVPGDRDQLYDIYDARVGGGLASQQFVPSAPCSGEACRTGAPAAPSSQSAGTATFKGPGNAKPKKHKPCKKGARKCHKKKHHKQRKNNQGQARSNKGDRK